MDETALLKAIAQIVRAEIAPLDDRLRSLEARLDQLESGAGGAESRAGGSDTQLSAIKSQVDRVRSLLEHDIPTGINILLEGHGAIIDRLPEAFETDGLRNRVRTLERVITEHTSEISALKHAEY